jgi:hypothetical protein
MSRAHVDYTARRASGRWQGFTDEPVAGFYKLRRGAASVYRPIAIWYGPPFDPVTGDELDRSPRWQAMFLGRLIWDLGLVWPYCAADRIDRLEYDYLLERARWASEHDPADPFGTASGRVDWDRATPPSF